MVFTRIFFYEVWGRKPHPRCNFVCYVESTQTLRARCALPGASLPAFWSPRRTKVGVDRMQTLQNRIQARGLEEHCCGRRKKGRSQRRVIIRMHAGQIEDEDIRPEGAQPRRGQVSAPIPQTKLEAVDIEKKATAASADAKTKLERQVAELKKDLKTAEEKLRALKRSTASRWREFESDLSAAIARLGKDV